MDAARRWAHCMRRGACSRNRALDSFRQNWPNTTSPWTFQLEDTLLPLTANRKCLIWISVSNKLLYSTLCRALLESTNSSREMNSADTVHDRAGHPSACRDNKSNEPDDGDDDDVVGYCEAVTILATMRQQRRFIVRVKKLFLQDR